MSRSPSPRGASAQSSALFPLEIKPVIWRLTSTLAVVGYALFGGGHYGRADGVVTELLYCRTISAITGVPGCAYFSAVYEVSCPHGRGIEEIISSRVEPRDVPGGGQVPPQDIDAAIASVTEMLGQDEDSLMCLKERFALS
jgi:hypothetical protein